MDFDNAFSFNSEAATNAAVVKIPSAYTCDSNKVSILTAWVPMAAKAMASDVNFIFVSVCVLIICYRLLMRSS